MDDETKEIMNNYGLDKVEAEEVSDLADELGGRYRRCLRDLGRDVV